MKRNSRLFFLFFVFLWTACLSGSPEPTTGIAVLAVSQPFALYEGPAETYPQDAEAIDGQATLALLARNGDCSWLKVKSASGLEGWSSRRNLQLRSDFECASLPRGSFRPPSAQLFFQPSLKGAGQLTIVNGLGQDGIAILTSGSNDVLLSAYVRTRESVSLMDIPDGTYFLYFATGSAWDGETFTGAVLYQRFDDPLTFYSSDKQTSIWEVTLHPIIDGNATTIDVDQAAFPATHGQ